MMAGRIPASHHVRSSPARASPSARSRLSRCHWQPERLFRLSSAIIIRDHWHRVEPCPTDQLLATKVGGLSGLSSSDGH
jgi:hypothetical protein